MTVVISCLDKLKHYYPPLVKNTVFPGVTT